MRDHGGNLDAAVAEFGGDPAGWIDLSTGINRRPYPLPALPPEVWTALPTRAAMTALRRAVGEHYGCAAPVVALAGAQAAIQMIPLLPGPGPGPKGSLARVLGPTYNEHAAALRAAGWQVEEVTDAAHLPGADLAVVVNPNNPDGQRHAPEALLALVDRVGRLVVDESFGDVAPELSMLPHAGRPGLLVLRSFGKFWGLAGVRLGFAFGDAADCAALASMAGPWPVTGAAIAIGRAAYGDIGWAQATRARLAAEAGRLDARALAAGWRPEGGCDLFRLYRTPDAAKAQALLARAHIWSRIFPWHGEWLRLGLPGDEEEWQRLERIRF